MAHFIEKTNFKPERFVHFLSRYMKSTVLYYTDRKLITFETYKREPISPTRQDKFMVINKGVEYRPDLVSFDNYGTCDLWWKIMEANNMMDIMEFKAGTNIVIPDAIL